jgi:nitrite reductase (NO-forming)
MPDSEAAHLSDLLARPATRRDFITRASALSLAIPGVGAALAACAPNGGDHGDSSAAATRPAGATAQGAQAPLTHNSDSRLDSAVLKGQPHTGSSATHEATEHAAQATYHRIDPALPPLPAGNRLQLHFHAREAPVRVSDDLVVAAWTFDGDIPGPMVHCRVGDTVEFTLTNDADIPHSMDFHAAQIDPKVAFRSVIKGQSVTYTFKPRWAGVFMYHCGTAPVLMHIGSGMYGAIPQ